MPLGGQTLLDQDNAVRLFHDCFDPVTPAAAEQEEGMVDAHGELFLYDCTVPSIDLRMSALPQTM